MRIVETPLQMPPHSCLYTSRDDGRIIDFQRDVVGIDPHLYLKAEIVEQAARDLLGMVPAREVEELREQLEQLGEELEKLRAISDATEVLERAIA